MMDSRIYHFIVKEFRQLFRDSRMLRTILVMPVIQLLMFGYIATLDIKHIPTAVMDEDKTSLSRAYVRNMENAGYFDLKYYVSSEREFTQLLDSGKASIVVRIPRNFKKNIVSGGSADVQAVLDGSNSSNATIISGYITQLNLSFSNGVLMDRLNRAGMSGKVYSLLDLEPRIWYNPELTSLYFMVPAIFAQVLMMISLILTMFSVVKEKEKGTIEQLIVTPLRPYELIIGKIIPPMSIAFADTVLAFLVATLWFRVPMRGSVILLFILGILFSCTGLAIALLVSTVAANQRQAIMTNNLIMSPQFILSGFFFPIASMPVAIQWVTRIIPLRYFLIIVRSIFLKGNGIRYLWPEVWPMIIFVAVMLSLSIARFRSKLD